MEDNANVNVDLEFEKLISSSTLPAGLSVSVSGSFPTEADAQLLSNTVYGFLKVFGALLNLEALDGVTVADDYHSALAGIDRGFGTIGTPTPTNDTFGTGFAMSLPVIRDGIFKTHIVLDSRLVRPLTDSENDLYKFAIHTLCHESAHAHDHLMQSRAFPGFYGSRLNDYRDGVLTELALAAWDEYIASRLSASWGTEDYCSQFEDALCSMLKSAKQRGNECIDRFSDSRDVNKTVKELADVYGALLTRASYLIGHLDGLNLEFAKESVSFFTLIDKTDWFSEIWVEYVSCLEALYASYGEWTGVEVLEPLKQVFEKLLRTGGVGFVLLPTGNYYVGFNRV
jgi:hypothetical protein